ncbi:hypothetical protein [Viridibacterium curvum]|uniref:DUF2325 domain-containing protein n=1 Tax=Viridibacterium curvum TaxID=1101404 RepID=A0ABP9QN62_9RHOO
MNALIVGADRIEPIRQELERQADTLGIHRCLHWSGRTVGDTRRQVPDNTRLIVVICDRLNHQLLNSVRKQAGKLGVPVIYARHSLIEVRSKLRMLVTPA